MNPRNQDDAIFRILDANINRAMEGLRTIEEYTRFALDQSNLTQSLKGLRHDLGNVVDRFDAGALLQSRDTRGDVGTTISTPSEVSRRDGVDVVAAAARRTQQALRCLEEFGKTVDASVGHQLEQMRYRAYTVLAETQQAIMPVSNRVERLTQTRLYAITETEENADVWRKRLDHLIEAGAGAIQIRDKSVTDRQLLESCQLAVEHCSPSQVLIIVNDRADIAHASDADGVHVGQDELPVEAARSIVGRDRIVGLSTHTLEQVEEASSTSCDYIGCGPTFPSQTKSFDQYPGAAFLREVTRWQAEQDTGSRARTLPVFAIGGITPKNARQVAETGIGRVATTAALAPPTLTESNAEEIGASLLAPLQDNPLRFFHLLEPESAIGQRG
ncbi:MAG: thiamine phosphate synthase [Planctomycetota bacterium]